MCDFCTDPHHIYYFRNLLTVREAKWWLKYCGCGCFDHNRRVAKFIIESEKNVKTSSRSC